MKIINLTPHEIVVETQGIKKIYPTSGRVIRLDYESLVIDTLDGFTVSKNELVSSDLPARQPDVYLLVSSMVLAANKDRSDLISPDTGNAKRNDQGHIVSVPGFIGN